jgi:hypothetical protein
VGSPERDLTPGVSLRYDSIPKFYLQSSLLSTAKGIIEYPVLIGDQLNLYYYYQHFHRLPVVAGFASNNIYAPISPGRDYVYGDWVIDSVMGAIPKSLSDKTSWRTMVDLGNPNLLRARFKGWLLIIHRDTFGEIFNKNLNENPMSIRLAGEMIEFFGNPDYSDEKIAVWKMK